MKQESIVVKDDPCPSSTCPENTNNLTSTGSIVNSPQRSLAKKVGMSLDGTEDLDLPTDISPEQSRGSLGSIQSLRLAERSQKDLSEKLADSFSEFDQTDEGKRIAKVLCNFLEKNSFLLSEDLNDSKTNQGGSSGSTDEETSHGADDDDSMEMECSKLARSEDILRKELMQERLSIQMGYTMFDHYTFMKLSEIPNVGEVCDISEHFSRPRAALSSDIKEFCQPVAEERLASTMYSGLKIDGSNARFPFRTLVIRIRPDVLCGNVMDALFIAVEGSSDHCNHLLKRQGGHLRAVVLTNQTPYVLDAQLCITRNENHQRHLLLRFYHASNVELAEVEISNEVLEDNRRSLLAERGIQINNHLREASALLQIIKNKNNGTGMSQENSWTDKQFCKDKHIDCPRAASVYLRSSFRPSPSARMRRRRFSMQQVSDPSLIFPSLSMEDWPFLLASWRLCDRIWQGLADDIAYSSLLMDRMDTSKQSLDFQYCMQLYSLPKEQMHVEATHVVEKLEKQVERAQEVNDIFAEFTKTCFDCYLLDEVEECQVVNMFDLESGIEDGGENPVFLRLAKEALEESRSKGGNPKDNKSPLQGVEEAVQAVSSVYIAYLNRVQNEQVKQTNANIMNRLMQKQYWLHENYKRLRNSYKISQVALLECSVFLKMSQLAENQSQCSSGPQRNHELRLLPLSKFAVDGGMCLVTASHILVSIHRALFASPRILIFGLQEIDIRQSQHSSSRNIKLMMGNKLVYRLRPLTHDSSRLKCFLTSLQMMRTEVFD